eukprot:403356731
MLNHLSITQKEYQTAYAQSSTTNTKFKNYDQTYNLSKSGGRKGISTDIMLKLYQQKSLSRKRNFGNKNYENLLSSTQTKINNTYGSIQTAVTQDKNQMNQNGNIIQNQRQSLKSGGVNTLHQKVTLNRSIASRGGVPGDGPRTNKSKRIIINDKNQF